MEARSSKFLDPNAIPLKQTPRGNVWAQLVKWTKWAVLACFVALLAAFFLPVYQQNQALIAQREALKLRIASEQSRNARLAQEFALLKTNKDHVERIARDRLNLGKQGEMIFRFDAYTDTNEVQP